MKHPEHALIATWLKDVRRMAGQFSQVRQWTRRFDEFDRELLQDLEASMRDCERVVRTMENK